MDGDWMDGLRVELFFFVLLYVSFGFWFFVSWTVERYCTGIELFLSFF